MDMARIYTLLEKKILLWADTAVVSLPNFVAAIVAFILFLIVGKIIRATIVRLLRRFSNNENLVHILAGISYLAIILIGLFTALGIMKLDRAVSSLLAGAGILGLALGFAFREVASNYITGTILAFQRPFSIGDIVEIRGHFGTIQKISLATTNLLTPQGQIVVIPNREVYREPLINFSATGKRRVDVEVPLSYRADLEKALACMEEGLRRLDILVPGEEVNVQLVEFESFAAKARARFWIYYPSEKGYFDARNQGILAIMKSLRENGFEIPYPVRALDLKQSLGV